MVLAHRERLTPKESQADLAAQRLRDYAEKGAHLGPLPAPGVFARSNAVDNAALLPDGTAAESSISRVLAARGTVRTAPVDDVTTIERQIGGASHRPEGAGKAGATGSTTEDLGTDAETRQEEGR